ncbi:hypothetical protein CORC01_10318 [Colletotrichum orchidophilum]|uniref:Uncharacterized protein n=1 Tax=Colletotrichum orchidophilum TaxID=1209926 RepID=A0A1G4AYZ4_9PEZI|nr:uncharacterized protein CORC01_10318 [Colletotrichum orchidophilum]OHE94390.1 hypothetical protein CORC01_10318 [Colletotrichum orchidophilum]
MSSLYFVGADSERRYAILRRTKDSRLPLNRPELSRSHLEQLLRFIIWQTPKYRGNKYSAGQELGSRETTKAAHVPDQRMPEDPRGSKKSHVVACFQILRKRRATHEAGAVWGNRLEATRSGEKAIGSQHELMGIHDRGTSRSLERELEQWSSRFVRRLVPSSDHQH